MNQENYAIKKNIENGHNGILSSKLNDSIKSSFKLLASNIAENEFLKKEYLSSTRLMEREVLNLKTEIKNKINVNYDTIVKNKIMILPLADEYKDFLILVELEGKRIIINLMHKKEIN